MGFTLSAGKFPMICFSNVGLDLLHRTQCGTKDLCPRWATNVIEHVIIVCVGCNGHVLHVVASSEA